MSEESEAAAVVCGFWDEAVGVVGIGWDLGGTRGGALAAEGAVSPASVELTDEDGAVHVTLESAAAQVEASLSARSQPAPVVADEGRVAEGDPELAACTAKVTLGKDGGALECAGQVSRWTQSPIEGAGLFRHLAIPAPDDALVVATAAREPGRGDHAAERTAAWLIDAEGRVTRFAETLLSTQYDAEGRQTRVGLELWPSDAEAPAMRAAATPLGVAEVNGTSAAPVRSSAEGIAGLGAYLIWRP